MIDPSKYYISAREAGRRLDVSHQTVMNWLEAGRFPNALRYDSGPKDIILIPADDVETTRQERLPDVS